MLGTDDRSHPLTVFTIRRTNLNRLHCLGKRIQQTFSGFADRYRCGTSHAPLAGTPEGRIDQSIDRIPKIGIRENEHIVLGPTGSLHPFSVLVTSFKDVLGHRGRSNK